VTDPAWLLDARGLRRTFQVPGRGAVAAVDGVDIAVGAGEVVGLLGKNGAGKTTTLRMLATLLPPERGSVVVTGCDALAHPTEARRSLAYVPAEAGLPPRLTPTEVVSLFASLHGLDQPEQRARAQLERLGAGPYADAPCGGLSTGMKRRVVLARALVHGPRLLLLDEPTDGLDVPGRRDVLQLLRDLVDDGCGVLLSSHIMSEVEAVADRYVVLAAGRCVGRGRGADLLAATNAQTLDEAFLTLVRDR